MTARLILQMLLPLLPAAEPPALAPTRVRLDDQPRTLAAAVAEISRQANIPIDIERAAGDKQIRLRLDNVPFWEALDRLARAADQRLAVASQGPRIAFSREPYRAVPMSISGPFRFAVRQTLGRLNLDSGVTQHEVQIDVAWEPTFKAYYVELDPASLVAVNAAGNPLQIVSEGANRTPIGSSGPELSVKIRGVPRSEKSIARLEGMVKFLGTTQMLQFSFDLAAEPAAVKKAEVTGTLASFRKNVRLWTAVVELQYPRDMPEFESFQSFLLDNEAWLLRPDGTKFATRKFELGFEKQGKVPITYYFLENEKDGPVLGDRKGWKLVVRVPGRIVEEKVRFRLQDVPFP